MKLHDLAALVQVREHLNRIVTTSRADKSLMNLVAEMDKTFLENVKNLDVSKAGESVITLVKVGGNPSAEKLEEIREMFEQCKGDDAFSIVTDIDVVIERIAYSPSDAIAIKAGQVKVLGREVIAENGQLALNFTAPATAEEDKEIREALVKIEKAQSQEVLDKIAKAKEHATITDEGARAIIENEEIEGEQIEEVARKASKIEVDEEIKKKTEEEDEALISKRLADAKKKLSKTKKTTKKVFTRADE